MGTDSVSVMIAGFSGFASGFVAFLEQRQIIDVRDVSGTDG